MHDVPLEFFSKDNTIKMGNKIGEVNEVEDPFQGTTIIRGFLRAGISINVNKPFTAGFWLPRSNLLKAWIQIRYEKLIDFCFKCGRLGHDKKTCKGEKAMNPTDDSKPLFGPWLSTPPLKNLPSQPQTVARSTREENTTGSQMHITVVEGEPEHYGGNDKKKPIPRAV